MEGFADRPMTGYSGSRPASGYPTGSPMGRPMTGVGGSRPVSGLTGQSAVSPAPVTGLDRPMTGQHFPMDDTDFPAQQVRMGGERGGISGRRWIAAIYNLPNNDNYSSRLGKRCVLRWI